MAEQTTGPDTSGLRRTIVSWLERGLSLYDRTVDDSLKSWQYATYGTNAWLQGNLFPALASMFRIQRAMRSSVTKALSGEQGLGDLVHDTAGRLDAGLRYARLVNTVGKAAYGSATYAGETVLAETPRYRLSYLPPTGSETGLALFHAGGAIPYGDRIFRFTREFNFLDRFLERGVAVYAMELKGDRRANSVGAMTMEELVDDIAHLSDVAFRHRGERKMVLEGYCGQGTQALAYVTGRPADADRKFHTFATFVSPIDGRRCKMIAESVQAAPSVMTDGPLRLFEKLGGYIPGDALRVSLDLALGTLFYKTPLGYFAAGFDKPNLARVKRTDPLDAKELRDLAGAYWISPDCGRRFPVPVSVARFTTALFTEGISPTGDLPMTLNGERLSLASVLATTRLRIVGFYGGLDEVIPDQTAHILMMLFGDRYRHVVHPQAGHISYVLSPKLWDPKLPWGLKPNPVDVLLELAETAEVG